MPISGAIDVHGGAARVQGGALRRVRLAWRCRMHRCSRNHRVEAPEGSDMCSSMPMKPVHKPFDRMDLNLLRVFEAVFRERHLTRAARALTVTPSAVSHALRRLRQHLDEPLFHREGARTVPTAMCQRVAPALLEQLAQLRSLLDQWGRFDPRESTQAFRVGLSESVEPMLVPGFSPAFFRAAPAASLVSQAFDR